MSSLPHLIKEDNDEKPGLSTPILAATQGLRNALKLCILVGIVQTIFNMDIQDAQDTLLLHPVYPVHPCSIQ